MDRGSSRIPSALVATMLLAGGIAVGRWSPAVTDMAVAADPISDIDATTGPVFEAPPPEGETVAALTEPIEDVVEPELTDTSPELVDPEATTGPENEPEVVVAAPVSGPVQNFPYGRWVLFDRNGQPVDAVVEPWCVDLLDDCPEYGAIAPTCVWVEWLGSLRVRVPFRLSDGDPNACYSPSGQDRQYWVPPPAEIAGAMDQAPYTLELIYWDDY